MKEEETHIIRRILNGETALYEYFLERYAPQVFNLIIRIVTVREDAEELVQDAFLKAFHHLSSFKGNSTFSTWIYSIAYHAAISHVRKNRHDTLPFDDALLAQLSDSQVEETLNEDSEEQITLLRKAIELLPAEDRALVTLFYYEDKPLSEIAAIIGITESNAKVRLHRVRKKIYVLMNQQES